MPGHTPFQAKEWWNGLERTAGYGETWSECFQSLHIAGGGCGSHSEIRYSVKETKIGAWLMEGATMSWHCYLSPNLNPSLGGQIRSRKWSTLQLKTGAADRCCRD